MKYRFLRFPEGKFKAVLFSYDDGAKSDLRFLDILDSHGIKSTLNLCNSSITDTPNENKLTSDEVRHRVIEKGHEVAVHGDRHVALGISAHSVGIKDTLDCRVGLERRFSRIVRGYAYPDTMRGIEGENYRNIRTYLSGIGLSYARSIGKDHDRFELPSDWYDWMANAHHANPELFGYIDKFLSLDQDKLYCASRTPKLLLIWGHSFEFERSGNWELLEDICARLGGREDIWYATCSEIRDYVAAYDSLVFSADGCIVTNPTSVRVWLDVDKKLYCIEPGQTAVLQ